MPTPAAKACSSSYDASLARCDQSRPCPAALGGSMRIIRAGSSHGAVGALDGVVEEEPPRAHVTGLDVGLDRPAGTRLLVEVELAYAGADEPRHLLGHE